MTVSGRCMIRLFLCLLSGAVVSSGVEVDLGAAYELALARSESVQVGVAEWRAAEARYRQALGALWPELTVQGEANWTDVSAGDSRRAGLGAAWTIFDGFRNARTADARSADGQASSNLVAHVRLLLYEDVADVFYQVLSFQNQRGAAVEQLKAMDERVLELERRIKVGRSKRSDLLTTSNQIAEVRLTLEQLDQSCAASLELLSFLTGESAGVLRVVDRVGLPALGDVERFLAAARDRPDIRAGELVVESARSERVAAGAERYPNVSVAGHAYALRDPDEQKEWDLVLRLELPLFDRGLRSARVAEAGERVRISELRLAELRRSSQRDVRQAYQTLYYALRQWSELRAALGIAQDALDLTQGDYELGRLSHLDVLATWVRLWGLRQREAALACQIRSALVHLHVASGGLAP